MGKESSKCYRSFHLNLGRSYIELQGTRGRLDVLLSSVISLVISFLSSLINPRGERILAATKGCTAEEDLVMRRSISVLLYLFWKTPGFLERVLCAGAEASYSHGSLHSIPL